MKTLKIEILSQDLYSDNHVADTYNRIINEMMYDVEYLLVKKELRKLNKSWRDIEGYEFQIGFDSPKHIPPLSRKPLINLAGYIVIIKFKENE